MVEELFEKFNRDNSFLDGKDKSPEVNAFLIILNQPLNKQLFLHLYNKSNMLLCADGGANHLFNLFNSDSERQQYLPDLIIGDNDSIQQDIKDYYEELGVKFSFNISQSVSDLEKSLYHAFELTESQTSGSPMATADKLAYPTLGPNGLFAHDKLIILGSFGGRIDQTINSVHLLWKVYTDHPEKCRETEIILLDENSLMLFLEPGTHIITPSQDLECSQGCGLIPMLHAAQLQTQGLKYNMGPADGQASTLEWGSFISTSNEILSEIVTVSTNQPLLWITTLITRKQLNIEHYLKILNSTRIELFLT